MREQPRGEDLLLCARDYLKDSILPGMQGELRHGLLMVMNAMAIAARQLQSGDAPENEELLALRSLVDDPEAVLVEGNRLLARMLREGSGDPQQPKRDALLAHLRKVARQKVAESNPKALAG